MARGWAIPAAVVAGSAMLWYHSLSISSPIAQPGTLGPAFLPRLVLTGMIVVGLIQLGQVLVTRNLRVGGDMLGASSEVLHWGDCIKAAILAGLYIALLHLTGFIPATVLFQAAMLYLVFRQRGAKIIVLVPVLLTSAYFIIFIRLLEMPLPQGYGWFRSFSRLVYY